MTDPSGIRGLDLDAVSPWLAEHLPGAVAPFTAELIAAGGSNLTYRVSDAAGRVVALRRPPERTRVATAHDIDREWRVMDALGRHDAVPVPDCLARCDDVELTGAAFYVMSFVDGRILRTAADAATLDPAQAERATTALLEAQIGFHTLDLEAVGLSELGRPDAYVTRQLKRWNTQIERHGARPVPLIHELHDALSPRTPPERARPALVHGDYRFDNVVLDPDLSMAAVLDWELCTTGDPIADFAWSAQYWADPDDELTWLQDPPTTVAAFPRRAEVIERYAATTGFDLSDYPFYEAFSWWKQACIVEGVHARRLRGSRGGMADSAPVASLTDRVDAMLDHAHALVRALA